MKWECRQGFERQGHIFFKVTVCGVPSLFSYSILKDRVPEGYYKYELRDDPDGNHKRAHVEPWLALPQSKCGKFEATIISSEPLLIRKEEKRIFPKDFGNYTLIDNDDEFFKEVQ